MLNEFPIEEKNLQDLIKECHKLVFEENHVLVVLPLYTEDTTNIFGIINEWRKNAQDDSYPELKKLLDEYPKDKFPRIFIEKFSKRMKNIQNLNLKKISPELSQEMVNSSLPKPMCVVVFEKPKTWKRFSWTEKQREKIRNDFKNHNLTIDYIGGEEMPYDEQIHQTIFGIFYAEDTLNNLLPWFKTKITQYEYRTLSYAKKSLLSFIKSDEFEKTKIKKNMTPQEKASFIDLQRIRHLLKEGIRYDSVMASYWAQKLFFNNHEKLGKTFTSNGKLIETTEPGIKVSEFVDPEKVNEFNTDYELIEDIENIKEWEEFAIHLDPQNYFSWYNLGFIRYRMKDARAENDFTQSINSNPEWYMSYKLLSRIYKRQGFYRKAFAMIDVAIDRARKHYESLGYTKILLDLEELYSTRGEILLDAENYEDAIKDFDWCIDFVFKNGGEYLDPILAINTIHYRLLCKIAALKNLDRFDEMIDVYKVMDENIPKNIVILNNLAYWLKFVGKKEESHTYYQKVLDIDSNTWTANLGIAQILIEDGKRQDAAQYAKTASKKCPKEYRVDVMEMHTENMEKILEDEQNKSFQEQVKNLGGFQLSSDKEVNDKLVIQMLQKCEEFIFWVEPYYTAGGLGWIEKTCQQPTSVKKVEILTKFTGGENDKDEIFTVKFRKKFERLRSVLSTDGIELSMRICMDKKHCKLHGRYIMTNSGRSWNFTSIMNIKTGSEDDVGPSSKQKKDFEEIWNNSLDYVKDQKETEDKFKEFKCQN